jgi:hypothetical protein
MIIILEIEKFIQDIESRLPNLSGKAKENAQTKIAILDRVILEYMEYEGLLRKLAIDNNKWKGDSMKKNIEIRELKSQLDYAEKIKDKLIENYEPRDRKK